MHDRKSQAVLLRAQVKGSGIRLADRLRLHQYLLQRGYVETLGKSLRTQADRLDLTQIEDDTTRSVFMETIVTWAVHVHWDPAPDDIGDADARANVKHFLTRALLETEDL